MEVLSLTVLLSSVLAALALAAYVWDRGQRGHDGLDRESLRPLEPDTGETPARGRERTL